MEARKDRSAAMSADRKGGKKGGKPADGDDDKSGKYVPKPTAEAQTLAGRASKLLGRFGAAQLVGKPPGKEKKHRDRRNRGMSRGSTGGGEAAGGEKSGFKGPEQFVFEGRRASARDGKPKDLKFKTKGKAKDKVHKKKKGGKIGK
jgi:nucleolar protein 12